MTTEDPPEPIEGGFSMVYALILFIVTYILMLAFQKFRPWIALGSAAIFLISGMLPLGKALESVDFNVLMMIAGTMGTVALMIESKMPALPWAAI